jgi:hypothetical protein
MATTMQQVADKVRARLKDDYKNQLDDTSLLEILNESVKQIYNMRPDYFIGSFGTSPPADVLLMDNYPLPDETIPHAVNYAVAMIEVEPGPDKTQSGAETRFLRGINGN